MSTMATSSASLAYMFEPPEVHGGRPCRLQGAVHLSADRPPARPAAKAPGPARLMVTGETACRYPVGGSPLGARVCLAMQGFGRLDPRAGLAVQPARGRQPQTAALGRHT